MTRLSLDNLGTLPRNIQVPSYSRSALTPGIVHFGVGNFHRAHLAVYLDDLFNQGMNHDWAIIGAGILPHDEIIRQKLLAQDYLTTVVEQEAESSKVRVTGAMIDFIPPSDRRCLISTLTDSRIRLVSLTITEGGYMIDPATGRFDPGHPALVRDAANPNEPTSVFGLILAGLSRRRDMGVKPFTVMSCDNVPHNGSVTRNALVGLARLYSGELAEWVQENVAFPNAMVDRITPATSERERDLARDILGKEDSWPVFCEGFRQWVIEDDFTMGRPAFERAGATFVSDVTPWENMKIRILNGGHAVIAYPAGLMDIHFVHEAMANKLVSAFLEKVEQEEIIPVVPSVPGTNLQDYFSLVKNRFANPKIGDTVRRLCLDGSNRQPKFIVPSIADRLATGKPIKGLAMESALWCRYCFGVSDSGIEIPDNDPAWAKLQETARRARNYPLAWLEMPDIYGSSGNHQEMRHEFAGALGSLWSRGTVQTLKNYLSEA
jgi:mannitol 2-dehydrogenase